VQAVTLEGGAMQLKNAVIGALVGGASGIGFLIAAYFLFGADHMALAIVVAILTGVGVRMSAATKGHASYARGAITALLAILAFVGGKFLVAAIAGQQATASVITSPKNPVPPPKAEDQINAEGEAAAGESSEVAESEDAATDTEETTDAAQIQMERSADRTPVLGDVPRGQPLKDSFSVTDYIWLFGAALIAYELGRGSGIAPPAVVATPEPTPT
jgi:hypothetical protein